MPELIDRQVALEKMCGDCKSGYDGHCPHPFGMCHEYESILQVPTIEPEVRHGRWKKKNGEIYCTNCKKSKWSESFELMLRGFDFCPKCGARMDGGADSASD